MAAANILAETENEVEEQQYKTNFYFTTLTMHPKKVTSKNLHKFSLSALSPVQVSLM